MGEFNRGPTGCGVAHTRLQTASTPARLALTVRKSRWAGQMTGPFDILVAELRYGRSTSMLSGHSSRTL